MKLEKAESRPSFPKLEAEVLARWKEEGTYEASLQRSKQGKEFVIYDGPPFPTGNPHHGTLLVSVLKDVIPRYKTMRGYYVPRAWGWDCHGLPIETQAEKRLGITDKTQIESSLGVARFNDECRAIVSAHNESWRTYIERIGRWVDFEHPYSTRDLKFMESVMWAFKECYQRGFIYKDFRVSPYCYRCQTALSISDTRQDDSTRPRQDRAITVKFPVVGLENTYFLAWTTTPWTLPSNLALAVGCNIQYSYVKSNNETFILGTECLKHFKKEIPNPEVLERITGEELLARNLSYTPLFPYFTDQNPNGFKLIPADFVGVEEGTGIVHLAPAYGDDDYWACKGYGIGLVNPVDQKGLFTDEVRDFNGKNVHEANGDIIRFLKVRQMVVRDETIEHAYPHCWRCQTPLIYRALDAWYFKVEAIKDKLLAANQEINWHPDSVKEGRFGKWLENARDWNISRNRYWATPIPIWECDKCDHTECLGSLRELEEKAGKKLHDIHKEWIDPIKWPCSCGGIMHRTPEVLDCWFESGSMPYGQFHYPFENADHFSSHFPGEFVVEYSPQLRGWFYVMHVLSSALFGGPAFTNCMVHGTILAADGKKMSKSLKNYTDPLVLLDKYGADAFRAYLLSSAAVEMGDLAFQDEGVEGMVKSLNLPLWNALLFFTTYAEIDKIDTEELDLDLNRLALTELDRYILSETEILISSVTEKLENYLVNQAMKLLPDFLGTLNNWYIRRSRQRVWTAEARNVDKLAFYSVLYRVLTRFSSVLAPFCPFMAESVRERLGYTDSVHLVDWPTPEEKLIDKTLSGEIALVREIITAGLSIRAKEKIRVRQPLSRFSIATHKELDLSRYFDPIREELNVKEIKLVHNNGELARCIGRPNAKLLGPKYGGAVQTIIKLAKEGQLTSNDDGTVTVGDYRLLPEEIEIAFVGNKGLAVESTKNAVVALKTTITPQLEMEGYARDIVRQVQELRKEADLHIADRIALSISGADGIIEAFGEYIKGETLTTSLVEALNSPLAKSEFRAGDRDVSIALRKI